MSHVLAAIDFSDLTEAVTEQAERIGKATGSPVTLLHVAAPNPDFVGLEVGPDTVRVSRAKELREEHRDLLDRAASLRERGVEAKALLVEGPTVDTILEEADRLDSDMIVIGSHGHGALYEALVGSICEGVVRRSTCPVLVVPHSGLA